VPSAQTILFICCFETGTHYVAQAGLKPAILQSPPPEFWDLVMCHYTQAHIGLLISIFTADYNFLGVGLNNGITGLLTLM
jgi:hypothetical protein